MIPSSDKPVLFVDVDGVISLFDLPTSATVAPESLHLIDGVAHCIPETAGPYLERLASRFELVWATGWENRANEHLPSILNLTARELPSLTFGGCAVFGSSHWKLQALDTYAGDRPAAWIDDNLADDSRLWAISRSAPTLLVQTRSCEGLTEEHVRELMAWAAVVDSRSLAQDRSRHRRRRVA